MAITRSQQGTQDRSDRMTSYQVNPFRGDINPGTAEGLRLFLKATAQLDEEERYGLKPDNAKALMDHLLQASNRFRWNKLIDQINMDTAQRRHQTSKIF